MSTVPPQEPMDVLRLALLGRSARAQGLQLPAEPIAVIGIGCRFPGGAHGPGRYWSLLLEGFDGVREVPADRWSVEEWYDPDLAAAGKTAVKNGGFLDDPAGFDADFFGIGAREAERIDPHQRLALEVAWEALEDAGLAAEAVRERRVGVFAAAYNVDYILHQYLRPEAINERTITGVVHSVVSNRISYFLDLHGPSLTIDTACSSSLVAVHLACASLREGGADLALAGGVSVILRPEPFVALSKAGFMAPDGRCKTFDARADGFGRGEGCGFVVLKRLADALADGDRIDAVIRGSAVNQDGHSTILAAPNGRAQVDVVRRALAAARVAPAAVTFIEAHGTGTRLGDPIEVDALAEALGPPPTGRPRWIGSVKANIGHTEAAAGIAGLIKAVLCLKHRRLVPQVAFDEENPLLHLSKRGFVIPREAREWPDAGRPRTAGVSSFGVGGTNAHVVLEEAPAAQHPAEPARPTPWVLPVSARTSEALMELAGRYARLLRADPARAAELCAAAARTRTMHREQRLAAVAATPEALIAALEGAARNPPPAAGAGSPAGVCFVYTGQGSQWAGMATEAMAREPAFAAALRRVNAAYVQQGGPSIIKEMGRSEGESRLDRTDIAQMCIFGVQVALTELLAGWGVRPAWVVGHSVGELAAAYAAGMLTLEEAIAALHDRASAMQSTFDGGRMISVRAPEGDVREFVRRHGLSLAIAAVNGPEAVVLSGATGEAERARALLERDGIQFKPLNVRFAFHSPLMEDAARRLGQAQRGLVGRPPAGPAFISTVTGLPLERFDGAYLAANVLSPVHFADAIATLLAGGCRRFVELGPHPALGRPILEQAEGQRVEAQVAFALHRERGAGGTLMSLAGRLFEWGEDLAWERIYPRPGAELALPIYPWRHERHWLGGAEGGDGSRAARTASAAFPGRRLSSPALAGPVYELELSDPLFAGLADHRIRSVFRLPGTAVAELLRTAGAAEGLPGATVRKLVLTRPIEPERGGRLQLVLSPAQTGGGLHAELYCSGDGDGWMPVASADLVAEGATSPAPDADRAATSAGERDADGFYAAVALLGCDFGPGFRLLTEIRASDTAAVGRIAAEHAGQWSGPLHPAAMDAAAQLSMAVLEARGALDDDPLVPWAVEAYRLGPGTGAPAIGCARLAADGPEGPTFDLYVRDAAGAELAAMLGCRLRRAAPARVELRRLRWEARAPEPARAPRPGSWAVCGDGSGLAEAICEGLRARGLDARAFAAEDDAVLLETLSREPASWAGVVYARAVDAPDPNADYDPMAAVERSAAPLVQLARRLADGAHPGVRLVVLTRAAQWAGGVTRGAGMPDGSVRGIARALRAEAPELQCVTLDLDAPALTGTGRTQEIAAIVAEVLGGDSGSEAALRGGRRLVARLEPGEWTPAVPGPALRRLVHEKPGTLDGLVPRTAAPAPAPAAGQLRVRVLAAGLNFRDVLSALGVVPAAGPMGHEACGEVTAVGAGVSGLAEGDRVLVFWPGCFAGEVTVPAEAAVPAPRGLDPVAAATLPIAYATAWFALAHLAKLERGQRVLVHAAAGGVGMAACQLALVRGATVYATAGSEEKRSLLRTLGVAAVFDSRSTAFEQGVREATGGAGVDIVLNSLIGEMISAGLGALRPGGVFVELGKRERLRDAQVRAIREDCRYLAFDLREEALADATLFRRIFEELTPLIERGDIAPLPAEPLSLADAGVAFRRMARAEHIGKLVLLPQARASGLERGWNVVSGGAGTVGLATVRWLAARGARRIAVLSRGRPAPAVEQALAELAGPEIEIRLLRVDVSVAAAADAALAELRSEGLPLVSVFHAAGVVDDATLANLDWSRARAVLEPKVAGAWNLHRATRFDPVRAFVLYSAVGPLVDAAGQGSYAAANAYMDGLAAYRRGLGLPAVSVLWGPWAGGGMLARLGEGQRERWKRQGLRWWDESSGAAALDAVLEAAPAELLGVQLEVGRGATGGESGAPWRAEAGSLRTELGSLPPHRRRAALSAHVQECATSVLGRSEPVDPDRPLRDLGMDSLSAIELRNALTRSVGRPLPTTLAFDYPTCDAITAFLAGELELEPADVPAATPARDDAGAVTAGAQGEDDYVVMSDDEAEALLRQELAELRPAGGSA